MHYLIDGYNLLFRLTESKKTLQTQRHSIIRSLQKEFKFLDLSGTVVFDGSRRLDEMGRFAYHSPLLIIYSDQGQSADQYILEKLESGAPGEIVVVTDDRFLASSARGLGAKTLSLNAFLSHLEKKHAQKTAKREEKESFRESKNEFGRLLKIFEERLRSEYGKD